MKGSINIPPIIIILFGLIIYSVSGLIGMYSSAVNYVKILAVIIVLIAFFKAPKNNRVDNSPRLIQLFAYYTIFIILRGSLLGHLPINMGGEITSVYGVIRYVLISEFSSISFLLILCVLIPFDSRELQYYRPLAYICIIMCLVTAWVYKNELFSFDTRGTTSIVVNDELLTIRMLIHNCFIGVSFILLYGCCLRVFKKSWFDYFAMFIVIIYGVAQVAGGGRGGSVTALLYILCLIYFFLKNKTKKIGFFTKLLRIIIAILLVYGVFYFLFRTENADFLFSRMFEDGIESGQIRQENRSYFTDALLAELDSHPWEWIIGKGINGSFFVGGQLRSTIEWGFMYLILKGGLIYMILYIAVLLRTFFLGFFRSNNVFSKAMAALCLLCAYSLIPFGLPRVSLDFVIVWHYVRLVNTNSVRNMTNDEIMVLINSKIKRKKI